MVTEFGTDFLRRFHMLALSHPSSIAFVAFDGDGVVGFLLSSVDVQAFNGYVKPRVVTQALRALLNPRRWHLGVGLLRGLMELEPQPHMPAELLLLVVRGHGRRQGVGRLLVEALEASFGRAGISRYRVAVRSQLTVARAFYQALDFKHEQDLIVLGQPMTYLTKQILS